MNDKEKEACSKKELLTFIYTRVKYPSEARKAGIEGMSVVEFTVMKDGSVGGISIKRSVGGGIDEAVLTVMDEMVLMEEKWTPGMQDGKPVNVRYTLPVRFKLDGPAKKTHPVKKQKEEKKTKEKVPSKSQMDLITVVGHGQNLLIDDLVNEEFLSELKVFPNPAQDEVNVEVNGPKSPLEIRVHDLSGKLLYRQMINDFTGSYKGTLRSENFINTQAVISFIQEGKVQSQQIIFSK
jgi:TonB family protein